MNIRDRAVADMLTSTAGPQGMPIQIGMRVALIGKPTEVTLRTRTGVVVREDECDYLIVRLDIPAIYHNFDGTESPLPEIAVLVDNLQLADACDHDWHPAGTYPQLDEYRCARCGAGRVGKP